MERNRRGKGRKRSPSRVTLKGLAAGPRLKRQASWVALVVGCLVVGYAAGRLLFSDHAEAPAQVASDETVAQPWYRTKPAPSKLVDEPILPENGGSAPETGLLSPPPAGAAATPQAKAAYEEALPTDSYLPAPPGKPQKPVVVDSDAKPAWMKNAIAYADPGSRPMVAIVIDDLGVDHKRTDRTIRLSGPLTLAFLSYAPDLASQNRRAAASGHELLLHLAMEPKGRHVDPGPDALLVSQPADVLRDHLAHILARTGPIVGVNNHMGSLFTENRAAMALVLNELRARGLLFLDSRTSPNSVAAEVGHEIGLPVAERNVFLDNDNNVAAVRARLRETERIAEKHGFAIAIGHPRDATLEALDGWLGDARRRGFAVVPLSAIVKRTLHLPA